MNYYEFKKEKDNSNIFFNILKSLFIKTLFVIVIFLVSLIYINQNDSNKELFKKYVYSNSLSFAKIYNTYKKYIGDIIPFKNNSEDTKLVSDEKFIYNSVKKDNNGYIFEVDDNSIIPSLKSGIVIKLIKKDNYYTISIMDKNNVTITYDNITNPSISLYDYIKKGEIIGEGKNNIYIEFNKGDKFLSYEEFI